MEEKKISNKGLIVCSCIAFIMVCFLLFGCGPRKVERSKTETKETQTTETTFKDSSKTVTKLESNTRIVDSSVTDEFVIIPFDNTKEMVVNGKTYFNTVLKRSKSKNNISTTKSINVAKTSQNDVKKALKNETAKESIIDTKKSDRGFNYLSLLWLLIIPVIYFCYRKFKGLPLV